MSGLTPIPPLSTASFENLQEMAHDWENSSDYDVRRECADRVLALAEYVQELQTRIVELQNKF